ncbi:hypothetical protein NSP03_24280, partial [Salmonella enterica]|nr:hypothetical protein [Salmonella enterica]
MNRHSTRLRAGRLAMAVAGTVAASLALAGCGGGAASTAESPAASDIDPDGIIEAGISYTLNGSFDPMVASG